MDNQNISIEIIAKQTYEASRFIANSSSAIKLSLLNDIEKLLIDKKEFLKSENLKDIANARINSLKKPLIDRLTISDNTMDSMIKSIEDVKKIKDPIGEIENISIRPNGLMVGKMRIPLGVIGIIYESRPNVTIDASILCLLSGNAAILRGGSEAINSNLALISIIKEALRKNKLPEETISMVPYTDRSAVLELISKKKYIDIIIPRGGEGLISFVTENSKIPVIKHDKGVCHIYIDEACDIQKAVKIVINAKVQRPSVCNALETLLVHEKITDEFMPVLLKELHSKGVETRLDGNLLNIFKNKFKFITAASENDWNEEYLDLILSIKSVNSIESAIEHIKEHGSNHTEAIITENYTNAMDFIRKVNSSCVLINASTRFNDGFELGLGAEIGISTSKIHAYGPMGAKELTTTKFVVFGNYQTRL
ncbi:MAG: glutamate-5-semialdehyde dehydrogenase [Candidatus Acididesulfobacter diazotrophicus]|jgi:glutamate-5-semialdehyde dehydrogenase|uniref:Gamma-glutamyl phosphate reductase n=1 Tax=Candidatus Acididesulfobacter diazotrophicus TaxID=2597226 RepID=A0A519BMG8_9DELT|nr:MAG: glutamate-5-semialdehyde dehydrogenase [Candidatus Acididesulfobacter diazotrophicus]